MLRVALLSAAALTALTTYAEAGACLEEEEIDEGIKLLEQRVTKPKVDMSYLSLCLPGALEGERKTAKRIARINAACTKTLIKKADDRLCLTLVGYQGTAELGGVKIFDAIAAWNSTPWSTVGLESDVSWINDVDLFAKLGDARGVALIVERWKTFEVEAAKREAQPRGKFVAMANWATWRRKAAATLGKLGGTDEATFLDAQAQATKDRFVKQACLAAAKAIRARNP